MCFFLPSPFSLLPSPFYPFPSSLHFSPLPYTLQTISDTITDAYCSYEHIYRFGPLSSPLPLPLSLFSSTYLPTYLPIHPSISPHLYLFLLCFTAFSPFSPFFSSPSSSYVNDLDVATSGTVYFSSSTSKPVVLNTQGMCEETLEERRVWGVERGERRQKKE